MKKASLYLLVSSLLLPVVGRADCDSGAIVMKRETGFSISIGSKNQTSNSSSLSMNVPLTVNGKSACYRSQNSFELQTEEIDSKNKFKLTIKPSKVDFENVPEPHTKEYFYIETNPEIPQLTKIHHMTFICSGEIPLSVEANSQTHLELLMKQNEISVSHHMVFATGIAAQNLNRNRKENLNQETFSFFKKLYEQGTHEALEDAPKCENNIPSIISSTSINSLSNIHQQIAQSYTTMKTDVINGCAKNFSNKMKDYLIQNISKNESIGGFKLKKKRKSIILERK